MIEENTIIELASVADAAKIAHLSREEVEFGFNWNWTPEKVARAIHNSATNVIVAKDRQYLAGFGIMRYDDMTANLNLFAVDKPYRRCGVGTRLIEWLEVVALNAGIVDISVQLREQNTMGYAFYERAGFEVVDRVPGYYQGREGAIIMTKQLGGSASATLQKDE